MKRTRIIKLLLNSIFLLCSVCLVMQISVFAVSAFARYNRPEYGMEDIGCLLEKPVLTQSDYNLLFMQTGLTETGIERCRKKGEEGIKKILRIQKNVFSEYEIGTDYFAPFCAANRIGKAVEACYLEDGDVLVTSSTLFSGLNVGHAAIVTDAAALRILSAYGYGKKSGFASVSEFTDRPTFAVLSPKTDKNTKKEVAKYAAENLAGKPYGVTPRLFGGKYECKRAQCADLVCYAYGNFGIRLCKNRALVTPRDLLYSDSLEIVQSFGFGAELTL